MTRRRRVGACWGKPSAFRLCSAQHSGRVTDSIAVPNHHARRHYSGRHCGGDRPGHGCGSAGGRKDIIPETAIYSRKPAQFDSLGVFISSFAAWEARATRGDSHLVHRLAKPFFDHFGKSRICWFLPLEILTFFPLIFLIFFLHIISICMHNNFHILGWEENMQQCKKIQKCTMWGKKRELSNGKRGARRHPLPAEHWKNWSNATGTDISTSGGSVPSTPLKGSKMIKK